MSRREIIEILQRGGIGVLMTDTIFGLVGSAVNRASVARLYRVRRRSPDKPLIILISSLRDLESFGVVVDADLRRVLREVWPGPVSVIVPALAGKWRYLHRGTKSLAFRLPASSTLRSLVRQTGPLVAPSANPEGLPSATTLEQARAYFGPASDFYYGRARAGRVSTLVRYDGGKCIVMRQGAVKIPRHLVVQPS